MMETRLKRLTLFLLESIVMQGRKNIDIFFSATFNCFIEEYYEDNKELFALLYEPTLLEECLENNYEILSAKQMIKLINRYHGFEGYAKLLDDVGKEVDTKLIELATLFTEYHNYLLEICNEDSPIYHPKGYSKILQ